MSHSPASSGGEALLRAFVVLVALAALVAALYPDVLLPLLVTRGFDFSSPSGQETLRLARYTTGAVAGVLLLWFLGRPFLADWRSYRRRLKLARDERADAGRVMAEVEGRMAALTVSLGLLGFITYAFLARDAVVDQLLAPNNLVDTVTAVFYVITIVLTIFEVVRQTGAHQRVGLQRWLLIFTASLFVFIAGEELEWGRMPDPGVGAGAESALVEQSSPLQQIPLPVLTAEGTWSIGVYDADLILRVLAALLGIALPLLMLAFPSFARWLWAVGIPVPSRMVQFGFAVAALLPSDAAVLGWFGRDNAASELRELLCAGMVLLLIWQTVRSNCTDEPRPAALARL